MAEDASSAGVLISKNDINLNEESENGATHDQTEFRSETEARVSRREVRLRRLLRIHRYAPIKWKHGKCHIHFWYCLVMILQAVKIVLITYQMIKFADDRSSFSSVVNRGHLALRHLLLKNWVSEMETPPYPPAHGDFAMYDIKDLLEEINYAVAAYYNIENDAIGFYKLYDNGNNNDGMIIRMKYFDFPAFDGHINDSGLTIKDSEIQIRNDLGLTSTVDPTTNKTTYTYNITETFEVMNITEPLKRLLSLDLIFSFHSVMVYKKLNSALCFYTEGTVNFCNEDNNGQMLVDLIATSTRKPCSDISISVPDVDLNNGYKQLGIVVIVLCTISSISSILSVIFAIFLFVTSDAILSQFDVTAISMSIGGFLSWLYILKIFKIHHNFHILFKILSAAFFPMVAYLLCIAVLFIGFFLCGYVVLGPYHVKFATASATIETLFSISNGDEIFATLANMDDIQIGTRPLWWFSRVYVCAYVSIFTVVVINILIAFFVGAHETIKDKRQKHNEKLNFGSLEEALYNLLAKKDNLQSSILMSSLFDALEVSGNASPEITKVKAELKKVWKKTRQRDLKNISKPVEQTLKAFIEGRTDSSEGWCCKSGTFGLAIYATPGDF